MSIGKDVDTCAADVTERTSGDSVAEPVDSIISSPGAYGVLGAIYTALAVPAALFPHSVCLLFTCALH